MRSECCESRVCVCTSDAFYRTSVRPCTVPPRGSRECVRETYLCSMVEGERALALNVVVSPVTQGVVGADNDLFTLSISTAHLHQGPFNLG